MHHLLLDHFGNFDFSGAVANVIAVALALFVVASLHLVAVPAPWTRTPPATSRA